VSGLQRDDCADGFSPIRIGQADHGRLGDPRVLIEDVLDLGRVDILAAADDNVLHTVGYCQEPLGIQPADVPGEKPALRVDHGPFSLSPLNQGLESAATFIPRTTYVE
jgi:hypothetical protein